MVTIDGYSPRGVGRPLHRDHAVIVVGVGARVAHLNVAADELLRRRDGLTVRRGALVTETRTGHCALQRAVAAALGPAGSSAQQGDSFLLPRTSGKRGYIVHVTPFTSTLREDGASRALVIVVDPEFVSEPTPELLRRVFGLTAAESEVALRVARGQRLQPISDDLSLSSATVKTHLQHVFAKTATHRQAELVRLLLTLAP